MHDTEIHTVIKVLQKEAKKWPESVLGAIAKESHNPFLILIACLLSLRTKDQTTEGASRRLFTLASDPAGMDALTLSQIQRAIYPVGFYRVKAKHIKQICRRLLDEHGGYVPPTIEQLLLLPGVGRKTANLVVTMGFRKPGICVDIHVHRITNRWGYISSSAPDQTEQRLRQTLPRRYWIPFNHLLVSFGQHICTPVSPKCSQCQISSYCSRVGVTRSR